MSNPIKYSDFIQPDSSIEEAINLLNELKQAYEAMLSTVKTHANDVKNSMRTANGATEESKNTIKKAIDETARLERVQQELSFAFTETASKVAELRAQLTDKNKELRQSGIIATSQSTSYKELKAQIALLVSQYQSLTKEQALNSEYGDMLLAKIVGLKNEVKQYDTALKSGVATTKRMTVAEREAQATTESLEKAKVRLANATSLENAELLQLMMQTKEANQVAKLNVIIANEAEGSYNRLSAQYSLNKIQLNKMSMAERETTESGKLLVKETNELYQSMIKLQEATGKHSLSVGNYRRAWDGLGMSVNQIMREVPAAGISLNTFFLAISNNVPILVDEIEKVSAANKVALQEGKATVNIWKSVARAIFSWQSMLVIGITILSMYGKQIFTWIGELLKGEKAIDAMKLATEQFNEVTLKGRQDYRQDITRLKLLYEATQTTVRGLENRVKAAKLLKQQYPKYFGDLKQEQILAGNAATAYNNLAASIIRSAMARAKEDKIVENAKKMAEIESERDEIANKAIALEDSYNIQRRETIRLEEAYSKSGMKQYADRIKASKDLEGYYKREWGATLTNINVKNKEIEVYENINKKLASQINATDLLDFKEEPEKKVKQEKDRAEQIAKANLDVQKKLAEAVTALEKDELEKRKRELIDAHAAERAELLNKLEHNEDLTAESRSNIITTIKLMGDKLAQDLINNELDIQQRILNIQEEAAQLRLDATIKGSTEEYNERLALLEINRKQEIAANRRLTNAERQDESAINAKWDAIILEENRAFNYDMAMLDFNAKQDIAESEFNLLRKTEYEKTKFKLQQEKERQMQTLKMVAAGLLKLENVEVEAVKAVIAAIDAEIGRLRAKKYDFYEMLGIKLDDDQKEALDEILKTTVSNLKEILQANIELAEVSIQKAEERVSATKAALQNEIDARNAGYASSVAQAQRDLELERKTLEKAQKEKEKAVKAQQMLDTVLQSTSLITAAAQIWKSLSGIPVIGIPLAIAGIATMFGSFAVAKVKAAQVSRAQAQTYGEGGYEVLQGGSHHSGNDVALGSMQDGRERRAEGGEMLAIIKKSQTRKYRQILPDVINSINKGIFEHKYMRSYDLGKNGMLNLNIASNADVKQLESDVKAIREQGERKHMIDSKGNTVETYKNLVRIYKA